MLGAARAILALLLVALPWTYGGVTPTGEALLCGGTALALVCAALARVGAGSRPLRRVAGGRPAQVALGAAAVAVALAALAVVPLPRGLVAALSPATVRWRQPEPLAGAAGWIPIALAPDASAAAVWRAAAAVALAWVAAQVVRRSQDALWVLVPVGVTGAVAGLYGVLGVLSDGVVTAWHPAGHGGRAHAPFVNANHLATACAMALPCLAAVLFWRRRGHKPASGGWALRVAGIGAMLAAVAGLLATLSRGGIIAALGGGLVFALMARKPSDGTAPRGAGWRIGVPAAALVVLFVLAFGLEPLLARFDHAADSAAHRMDGWAMAVAIFGDFPLLGAGAGSFGALSPAYQPAGVAGAWDAAHCDWLDLAARTGLLGLAAALTAVVALAAGLWRGRTADVRTARRMAVAGAAAALTAVAWHAVVDFPLQMPALAAWTGALAGLGLAAGDTSAAREDLRTGGAP